jgi:hypothetical protein
MCRLGGLFKLTKGTFGTLLQDTAEKCTGHGLQVV